MSAVAEIALVGQKAGGRMYIVEYASTGDPVLLVHEHDNPYDANAIAVYTAPISATGLSPILLDGRAATSDRLNDDDRQTLLDRQAGYLPRGVAAKLWLPEEGVLTEIGNVRYHPSDHERAGVPAGFDVLLDYARYRRPRSGGLTRDEIDRATREAGPYS